MRTRMVSLQTLRKRNCKVGFLIILGKEELKCALYVGQAWLYGPKTNILRYRPRKWGDEWAKVLFLSVLYHHGGWTRPNSISILAWPKYIYAWWCLCSKIANSIPTIWIPDKSWKTLNWISQVLKRTKKNWPAVWIRKNSVWSVQQGFVSSSFLLLKNWLHCAMSWLD